MAAVVDLTIINYKKDDSNKRFEKTLMAVVFAGPKSFYVMIRRE